MHLILKEISRRGRREKLPLEKVSSCETLLLEKNRNEEIIINPNDQSSNFVKTFSSPFEMTVSCPLGKPSLYSIIADWTSSEAICESSMALWTSVDSSSVMRLETSSVVSQKALNRSTFLRVPSSSKSSDASSSTIVDMLAKVDRSFSDEEFDDPDPDDNSGEIGLSKAVQFSWTLSRHFSWHVNWQLAHRMAPVIGKKWVSNHFRASSFFKKKSEKSLYGHKLKIQSCFSSIRFSVLFDKHLAKNSIISKLLHTSYSAKKYLNGYAEY